MSVDLSDKSQRQEMWIDCIIAWLVGQFDCLVGWLIEQSVGRLKPEHVARNASHALTTREPNCMDQQAISRHKL